MSDQAFESTTAATVVMEGSSSSPTTTVWTTNISFMDFLLELGAELEGHTGAVFNHLGLGLKQQRHTSTARVVQQSMLIKEICAFCQDQVTTFADRDALLDAFERHIFQTNNTTDDDDNNDTPDDDTIVTDQTIRSLFHIWNAALATGDATVVADRYMEDAILLPTVSDRPRTDREGIVNYFEHFLITEPQGSIVESHVKIGGCRRWAKDSGIYEFTMGNNSGDKVRARYTFLYLFDEEHQKWKIAHHHSSKMPQNDATAPKTMAPAKTIVVAESMTETIDDFEFDDDGWADGSLSLLLQVAATTA